MANAQIAPRTKDKLRVYCEESGVHSLTQGIDALLNERLALQKENNWLSKLVLMYEAAEDKRMENAR